MRETRPGVSLALAVPPLPPARTPGRCASVLQELVTLAPATSAHRSRRQMPLVLLTDAGRVDAAGAAHWLGMNPGTFTAGACRATSPPWPATCSPLTP